MQHPTSLHKQVGGYHGHQNRQDRQTWYLDLTFQATCEGQLSQFLRCFCLWLENVFKDGEKFPYENLYLYRDLLSQFQSFQIYCRQELNPSRLESTNTDLLHGTDKIYLYKKPSSNSYKLYHLSCLTARCLVFESHQKLGSWWYRILECLMRARSWKYSTINVSKFLPASSCRRRLVVIRWETNLNKYLFDF